ncbi:MAG: PH domain-containing protein [Deltaproteobacteria bacterium]|nr:PH domain-containing protein [Deltaproteobacteria bacterium]
MVRGKITVRRAWRSQLQRLAIFFALCAACVALSRFFPQSILLGQLFNIGETTIYLDFPLFSLLPFYALLNAIWPIYDALFTIDNRGLEMRTGILSLHQKIIRVRYEDIRSVELEQSLLDRALDTGTVGIGSAATGKIEIIFDGIGNPKDLQQMIQQEKDSRIKKSSAQQKLMQAND